MDRSDWAGRSLSGIYLLFCEATRTNAGLPFDQYSILVLRGVCRDGVCSVGTLSRRELPYG